jgi:excisionase family DNA binding protein
MNDYPPLMTADETIRYLRLDVDQRDPKERLRNLIRWHRLPRIRRGRLLLFRKAAVDAWLDGVRPSRT